MRRTIAALFISLLASSTSGQDGPAPDCGLYIYRAEIVRVIDGDTVVADIDLGFDVWLRRERLRLFGIDAPERSTDAGRAAEEALRDKVEGLTLYICTVKAKRSDREATGSFGRYLAVIYRDGLSINDWLVASGYAEPFER
ncbi:MAG: thermonuclease family protein [Pseudomonadota bacterium]